MLVENQPANLLRQVEKEKDPADRQRDEDELCEPADEAAQFARTSVFFDLHFLMFFPGSVQPRLLFTDLLQSRIMLSRPDARFLVKLDRSRVIWHGKICQRLGLLGPSLEKRMNSLQLGEIVPPNLNSVDCFFTHL